MARKQLAAYLSNKAEKRPVRKSRQRPAEREFDRQATGLPNGVIPAVSVVPCPSGDGSVLRVTRNLRGDTLAYMLERRQIKPHQFEAGREWQKHYYRAGIGSVKAMDTTKEPVDGGGRVSEGLTDTVRKAVKALARADAAVGPHFIGLIRDVLASGRTLEEIARDRGMESKTGRDRLGWAFRECLDALAVAFNMADKRLLKQRESADA